ncbi:hypothetical protein JFK97_06775 [Chromobacterium phragmitis]|uniref:hypothetical protein n=1 Tax=Chromobacterium amazonense TaxID=1382803 RepID=UPI0021B7C687|nr:hypothetical protein [Chromobacterium amazonense]MBM2884091.1 hypothetical protein [Chromobacterium amazonense]
MPATQYTVPAVQSLEQQARAAQAAGNAVDAAYYNDLAVAAGHLLRVIEASGRPNASTQAKAVGTQLQQALRGL